MNKFGYLCIAWLAILLGFSATTIAESSSETLIKNQSGTVLGIWTCNKRRNCAIKGEYLEMEFTGFPLIAVYKATYPQDEFADGAITAWPKITGDCVAIVTGFLEHSFFINSRLRLASDNPTVCGEDGLWYDQ